MQEPGLHPWVRKIPWRRKWEPTPVFLPGESHGQKSLVGYSPWGHKELDTTEWLTLLCLYFARTLVAQILLDHRRENEFHLERLPRGANS